ncbi:P-loop NTPase family protein [Halostella salina]|uniref:ATP-binding protein n=1 Tax=Halostella salina TaxID=1547897 RepID=UPI000EF847E9|nr:ATP-binding protein [Halostella salina]
MNTAFGAKTNWGKSYGAQAYTERNAPEVDRVIMVDYKDEFGGLVESGLLQRLTVPPGTTNLDIDDWHRILDGSGSLQLARKGCTDEQWREAIAPLLVALSQRDETVFIVIDEAHRLAPQRGSYPNAYDTLATTWHGDGMIVVWVTQRWAKLDEDIVSQCQSSLLGGFRSPADLGKIESVEYPVEVHQSTADRVDVPLPDQLLVDGEPLTLRRHTDDAGHTVGSEWIYSDDTTLRRVDSRQWELQSTHYGSDRKRIKHPFED